MIHGERAHRGLAIDEKLIFLCRVVVHPFRRNSTEGSVVCRFVLGVIALRLSGLAVVNTLPLGLGRIGLAV